MELNEGQLARMRVPELKMELRQRHLRTIGHKRELLERLRAALLVEREQVQDEEEEDEADDDDDDEEEDGNSDEDDEIVPPRNNRHNRLKVPEHDDEAGARRTPVIRQPRGSQQRVLLTFKDVEGTLKSSVVMITLMYDDGYKSSKRWRNCVSGTKFKKWLMPSDC
ncbi:uncharacterized protein LOC141533753 [Cotesia typhae]|uniref:uncharacterized protein LOC141533753 n=1 Tax=Cotesia typhae TaxID=2053667 RepID=UPI003D688F1F